MAAKVSRRFPIYVNFLVEFQGGGRAFSEAFTRYKRTAMIAPVILASGQGRPQGVDDEAPLAAPVGARILFAESEAAITPDGPAEAAILSVDTPEDETGRPALRGDTPVFHAIALLDGGLGATLDRLCALADDAPRYVLIRLSEQTFSSLGLQRTVRAATKTRWRAIKWMGFETMIRIERIAREGPAAAQRIEQKMRDEQADSFESQRDSSVWNLMTYHARKELAITPDDRVIDLGSGIGREAIPLSQECGWMVALDFSYRSVAELVRRKPLPAVQASITHVPLADESFDKALCSEVLQYLPTDDMRRAAVEEAFRILRPGGAFVLIVYNWSGFQAKFKYDKEGYFKGALFYHAYERGELRELLTDAGFADVRVRPIAYFWQRFHKAPGLFTALDHVLSPLGVCERLARWYVASGRRQA